MWNGIGRGFHAKEGAMLKQKIEKALNEQVNAELYSSYLYLAMDGYFRGVNLNGFAGWMREQAREEVSHAMRLYDYVYDRMGAVRLSTVAGPKTEWKSPEDAFEDVFRHEQKVTAMINSLVDLASAEKDHATVSMLRWFIDEQVEEEAQADAILRRIRMAGEAPGAMLMLDRELGERKTG
jgi:ferritin